MRSCIKYGFSSKSTSQLHVLIVLGFAIYICIFSEWFRKNMTDSPFCGASTILYNFALNPKPTTTKKKLDRTKQHRAVNQERR